MSQARGGKPPFSQRLPAMDGKQLRITQVEVRYAPGQASPPHSHPCPVVVRVIEGSVVAKVDDKAVLSAPVAKPAPAKRAALAKSTYVPYDYQLERESCCGPQ